MTDAELLAALSEIAPRTARQITGLPAPLSVRCVEDHLMALGRRGLVVCLRPLAVNPDAGWCLTPAGRAARDVE